jgi:lipid-binding SYLF domain-containing protein
MVLSLQGRSLGPQVCAQCSRIVFIFDSTEGVRDFLTGHHHFVTTAAGMSVAHVDHPEPGEPLKITIYTMHNGVAIGQSLDNYAIHLDQAANASLHGIEAKPGCIAEGMRIGPRRPWFQQVYERMLLPPGQPHDTTLLQ